MTKLTKPLSEELYALALEARRQKLHGISAILFTTVAAHEADYLTHLARIVQNFHWELLKKVTGAIAMTEREQ